VRERQDSLLPPEACPERDDNVHRGDTDDGLPGVSTPVLAGLGDPPERDEPVVQPVKLEQDGKQKGGWRVDEYRVHWSGKGGRVLEQGEVDGEPGDQLFVPATGEMDGARRTR